MNPGIYKIFELRFDADEVVHRRIVGRLWVQGDKVQHLEDHHNKLEELFPEDMPASALARRFAMLQRNPYYEVINEDNVAAGHHEHHLKQLDLGEMEADAKFVMTGDSIPHPQIVEIWHEAVMVDGRKLEEDEARSLLDEVRNGRLILTPV